MIDHHATSVRWPALLGLILVPVLVAGGLLAANWNDNARQRGVEAAIVNLDEPVTLDGQYVPLGRQLTAALIDSDRVQNLSWELASEEGAKQGLATGKYAAMVTIPKQFSAAATSYAGEAADAGSATIDIATSPVAGVADATLGKVVAQEAAGVLNETLTKAYLDQIYLGFNDMGDQFVTIADGAGELADGAGKLSDGITKLADGLGKSADGAAQLSSGTSALAGGLHTMADQTKSMPKDTRTLADGVATYVFGVNQLADQTIASVKLQGQLVDGVHQLTQGAAGLSDGLTQYQQAMTQLVNNEQLLAGANQAAQEQAKSPQVQAGLDQAADQAAQAATPAAVQAAAQAVPCPSDIAQVPGGCDIFAAGREAGATVGVTVGAKAGAQAGLQVGLQVGVPVGIGAAGQAAAAGLDRKDPQTGESLSSGAKALAGGLDQLDDQLQASAKAAGDPEAAIAKLEQLKSGGVQLANGTMKLANGIPQLTDGIAKSADGASKLADGTAQLATGLGTAADGGDQLSDGGASLFDGAKQLADGLAKGKDRLPTYSASDREKLSAVVATPISTTNLTGTAGFGAGWVTLLMVLGLWAGAMAVFLVFKPVSGQLLGSARSSVRLILAALLPSALVVSAQAVLVTIIGQLALQLSGEKLLAVGGLMLLTGLTFVVVNHALAAWFGNGGRLAALALALLSLATALTSAEPAVFAWLRPFSPLTPALDAVRAVVTESGAAVSNTFLLAGWLLIGLTASSIAIIRRRTTSFAALLEAHGVPA